jgi:hypothetical protein
MTDTSSSASGNQITLLLMMPGHTVGDWVPDALHMALRPKDESPRTLQLKLKPAADSSAPAGKSKKRKEPKDKYALSREGLRNINDVLQRTRNEGFVPQALAIPEASYSRPTRDRLVPAFKNRAGGKLDVMTIEDCGRRRGCTYASDFGTAAVRALDPSVTQAAVVVHETDFMYTLEKLTGKPQEQLKLPMEGGPVAVMLEGQRGGPMKVTRTFDPLHRV